MTMQKNSKGVPSVDKLPVGNWLRRQLPTKAPLKSYAEERAVLAGVRELNEAVERSGLTRAQVAEILGTSRAFVSQVLNGSANVTLKTLGAFLWATGAQLKGIETEPLGTPRKRSNEIAFRLTVSTTAQAPTSGVVTEVRKAV
jgi:hypothetical protein